MATNIPVITNNRLPLARVHVDPALNSRKSPITEKTVADLASAIKVQGLMHPPLVIAGEQLGPKFKSFPFVVIAGFRRFAALESLKQTDSDFRVAPSTWGIKEAFAANLAENLDREDLSVYELAVRCKEMRDVHKMTGPEIAKAVRAADPEAASRKPLTEGHVNNIIRVLEKVDPSILAQWQARHPKASIRFMFALAAEDNKKTQVILWRRACGEKIDDNGDPIVKASAAATDKPDTDPNAPAPVKRPSRNTILTAIVAIKAAANNGVDADDSAAMVKALEWAAGDADGIEGVNLDKRKAPEAPKSEEDKAAAKADAAAAKAKAKLDAATKAAEEAKAKAVAAKAKTGKSEATTPGKGVAGANGNASA